MNKNFHNSNIERNILIFSLCLFFLLIISFVSGLGVNIPTVTSTTIIISNISSNSSDLWITDEGTMDNVGDILGSDINNDLGWITAGEGEPAWNGNYSIFTGLINNASYLSTYNSTYHNNQANNTFNQSFTDLLYAGIEWDYNQTTATYNLYNAVWLSTYNETYAATTSQWDANYSILAGCVNNASYLSTYNSTYALNSGNATFNQSFTDELYIGVGNASVLSTYNATYAGYSTNVSKNWTLETYTTYDARWSGGNASWNQSFANELYAPNSSAGILVLLANQNLTLSQKITFALGEIIDNIVDGWITITGYLNVTQSITADNITLRNSKICNGTACFTLEELNTTGSGSESDPIWTANFSTFNALIGNITYSRTDNSTYANYATNVSKNWTLETYTNWNTEWTRTDNSSYLELAGGTMTGNLNISVGVNITNPTYIKMREISGACDLTINHSICSNSSGMWIIG